ncbi:MAG: di-heme oxidoredictase family protein [Myxococcota bacterium]
MHVIALTLAGCSGEGGTPPDIVLPPADHGPMAEGIYAPMGEPVPFATAEQREAFERGREVGLHRFTLDDGLGPAFNVTFCLACHEKPVFGGGSGLYRNFFLSQGRSEDGALVPLASQGLAAGGVVRLYHYGDRYDARPEQPDYAFVSQRNAIPFFGVGLLADLDEENILAAADPDDADGDGISGRPNYDRGFVGRFGMKAQTVSIEGFIRGPLYNHLGVTTEPLCDWQRAALPVDSSTGEEMDPEDCGAVTGAALWLRDELAGIAQAAAPDEPNSDSCYDNEGQPLPETVTCDEVPDPEMSRADLFDLVTFAMLLAPPQPAPLDDQTRAGLHRFDDAGCGGCHLPRMPSKYGPLPLYSDLLLHDMGPDLDDNLLFLEAQTSEFRTQPLWGVSAVGPYLHDGRAHTLDEAIRWHGGEAQAARDAYAAMPDQDRADLLAFLVSLGGADQATAGLIPPGDPVPPVGTLGGPRRELVGDDLQRFEAARRLFDRDLGVSEGVGAPRFNGDSCRACHFEPVVGGAGPRGVNAMRHGTVDGDGLFTAPSVGTVLHRATSLHDNEDNLPEAGANVFEHRQTPHVFGLGEIADISEATILSHADPDDLDGDGISGRPAWTPGDRLGRFGWKAQVPSIEEFVRDAMGTELGVTLPPVQGMTYGITADTDDVPDPELSADDADLVSFYLHELAPPPRQPAADPAQADDGEALFELVGCASCHVPRWTASRCTATCCCTRCSASTSPASRTAPPTCGSSAPRRWGHPQTAPYLHTGAADTLDQAIRGHDGEAAASRDAYLDLTPAERDALVAFLNTL